MGTLERRRNLEDEVVERQRYSLLEQVYLLVGEDCERRVTIAEIESQLGAAAMVSDAVVDDLVRFGYLDQSASGGICLTEKAISYLQREAWRRRTIRE